MWLQGRTFAEIPLWTESVQMNAVLWGIGLAIVVLLIDGVVYKFAPEYLQDDSGLNDLIFQHRSIWHIAVICGCVAICEEFLFRGVIQHSLGIFWTSVVFASMHWRYFKRWYLILYVFFIGYALGWIYLKSGSIWAPILAHFMIDFVLGLFIRRKGVYRTS